MRLYSTDSIALDQDRWPRKPYCSNDVKKYGQFPRSFKCAIKYRQIQPNPPGLIFRMILDIDKPRQPEPLMSWHLAGLPPPNWIAQNPENGNCHLSYELAVPVFLADGSRSGRYLSAIETGYGSLLKACPGYSGILTKNPSHEHWQSYSLRGEYYTLDELADWLPRKKIDTKRKLEVDMDVFSIGRNCSVFEISRKKAYEIVPSFWGPEGFSRFQEAVLGIVEDAWNSIKNHDAWVDKTHSYRLHEIRNTAASITKWTWKNFTPTTRAKMIEKTHSPDLQTKRGKRGGIASGNVRRERSDLEFAEAVRLGVSRFRSSLT